MPEPIQLNPSGESVYEKLGGDATFRALVDAFYARIEADPKLRAVFPADAETFEEGKENQYLFLSQYWGGPARYIAKRGHPRLRMRHMPFPITTSDSERWVAYMVEAMEEIGIPEPIFSEMKAYFERGAMFMVNQADAPNETGSPHEH